MMPSDVISMFVKKSPNNKPLYTIKFKAPPIEGITFSGGGPKGIAYGGAVDTLEKTDILKGVKRVSGASAGAMTAMMVAIGMNSAQITKLLKETDITKLIDVDLKPSFGALAKYMIKGRDPGDAIKAFMADMVRKQANDLLMQVDSNLLKDLLMQLDPNTLDELLTKFNSDVLIDLLTKIRPELDKDSLSQFNPDHLKDLLMTFASDRRKDVLQEIGPEALMRQLIKKDSPGYLKLVSQLDLLEKVNSNHEITFRDLHTLRSLLPDDKQHLIKDLYMVGTNKTLGISEEYSYENTPDMSIAQAAQISGAHPVMFKPFINEKGEKIADGGILKNMPVEQLEKYSKKITYNENQRSITNLCFILGDEQIHEFNQTTLLGSGKELTSFFKRIVTSIVDNPSKMVLGGNIFAADAALSKTARELSFRVIPLSSKDITTYTLDATEEQKDKVIEGARLATGEYLANQGFGYKIPAEAQEGDQYIPGTPNDYQDLTYSFDDPILLGLTLTDEHLGYLLTHLNEIEVGTGPDAAQQQASIGAKLDIAVKIRQMEKNIKGHLYNTEIDPTNMQKKIQENTEKIATLLQQNPTLMKIIQDRLNNDTVGQYFNLLTGENPENRVKAPNGNINYSLMCQKIEQDIADLRTIVRGRNTKEEKMAQTMIGVLSYLKDPQSDYPQEAIDSIQQYAGHRSVLGQKADHINYIIEELLANSLAIPSPTAIRNTR